MSSREHYRTAEVRCCGTCNHAYANSLAGGWCCTQGGPGEHQVTQPLMLCDQYAPKEPPPEHLLGCIQAIADHAGEGDSDGQG